MNLENTIPVTAFHLNYLRPLKKWRILDLKSLMKICQYESSYQAFSQLMLRLSKRGVVCSFREPFSGKKYFYLSALGDSYVGDETTRSKINIGSLIHDSKVVELVQNFLKYNFFDEFILEHEFEAHNTNGFNNTIYPDSILTKNIKNRLFRCALEVELTRKTKKKYINKAMAYEDSSFYDQVIYFFQDRGVLESYQKHIGASLSDKKQSKIYYAINPNLLERNFDFNKTKVILRNKSVSFNELFR